MKKSIVSFIAVIFVSLSVFAQNNQINRIPTVGTDHEQKQFLLMQKGFWGAIEAMTGISTHFSGHNMGLAEIDVTAGYMFNQFFRIGGGLGARYYIDQGDLRRHKSAWGLPIYASARGNMMSNIYRRTIPYWDITIGGSLKDGFFFRPTLGLKIGEPRQAFIIGLSYMGQEIASCNYIGRKCERYTSFFCLRLGFEY